MMHGVLRGIERRGAETDYGKDRYNQGRAKKPDARQIHPVYFLSTIGFLAARSPLTTHFLLSAHAANGGSFTPLADCLTCR
jgi:hypothetical protein